MLISHRYKFIYCKTSKTAGTSVESYFERFCMPADEWTQEHRRDVYESSYGVVGYRGPDRPADARWWNHMPAAQIKHQVGDWIWSSYFKFCAIRNPFERCISAFEHWGREAMPDTVDDALEEAYPDMTSEQRRFLHFVQTRAPLDRSIYLIENTFCMDDVIRFEDLAEGVERICTRLCLPFDPSFLPKFKTDIRRPEATVASLYTSESRDFVGAIFAPELKAFQYSFPEPVLVGSL